MNNLSSTGRPTCTSFKKNFLAGAVAVACTPALAWAQQDVAESPLPELEEVLVTGTHIKRTGFDGMAPVKVVDRAALEATGATNLVDVVRNLTVNSGSELADDAGNLTGTSQFNIRGLGLSSTLTLINGRRGGIAPVADGNGYSFFDINSLPLNVIERMEVLTDGASATYGSEAVGGVANIITRKGWEGFEISAEHNTSTQDINSVSFALGIRGDKGVFNLYGTRYKQTGNQRSDFDWFVERGVTQSITGDSQFTSSRGSPGSYYPANVSTDAGGNTVYTGRTVDISGNEIDPIPDPDCAAAGGVLRGNLCRYDFFEQRGELPEEDRYQIFAEYDYDLAEGITLFGEASFSHNVIHRFQGPQNSERGLISGELAGEKFVPASHPFNFFVADPSDPERLLYIQPEDWDNEIHTAVDVVCMCRPLGREFDGDRSVYDPIRIEHDYWRTVTGFNIDLPKNWNANVYYQYALSTRVRDEPWNFVVSRYDQALLDGTWNPFGTRITDPGLVSPKDGVSVAGNSRQVMDSFTTVETRTARTEQQTLETVFSGDLFEVPAGTVGLAVGAQYRYEALVQKEDALRKAELDGEPAILAEYDTSDEVRSVFVETFVPVLENLELQVALRYEDFDSTGSTTDPKLSARWQATQALGLRASWGTSFQAPTARQKGRTVEAVQVFDPCSGTNSFRVEYITEGNADLEPQSSENFNLGVVLQPLDELNISLDYWTFDYTDLITGGKSAQALADESCVRQPDGTFTAVPHPDVVRSGGQVAQVFTSSSNVGSVETSGIDLGVAYQFDIGSMGSMTLGSNVSYVESFDVEEADGSTYSGVGKRNFSNSFHSMPRVRGNISLSWLHSMHSAVATVRYISGYDNDQANTIHDVDAHTTLDLQYTLSLSSLLGEETAFTLGVNNVFDEDPPTVDLRPTYDRYVHDPRGRMVYGRIVQRF